MQNVISNQKNMIKKKLIPYQIGWECIGNFAEKCSWSHHIFFIMIWSFFWSDHSDSGNSRKSTSDMQYKFNFQMVLQNTRCVNWKLPQHYLHYVQFSQFYWHYWANIIIMHTFSMFQVCIRATMYRDLFLNSGKS